MRDPIPLQEKQIELLVRKADGSIRKQWQENKLGKFMRTHLFEIRTFPFGKYANKVKIKIR